MAACDSATTDAQGGYIRRLRRLVGWRQLDLAREIGLDQVRLSLAENSHIRLREDALLRVEGAVRLAIKQRAADFERVLAAPAAAAGAPAEPAAAEHHPHGGADHHG